MAATVNSWLWLAKALKISSEPTSPNNLLVGTNNVCEVLYKNSSFCLDLTKNMAAMGNYRLWLAVTFKIFSFESTSTNDM